MEIKEEADGSLTIEDHRDVGNFILELTHSHPLDSDLRDPDEAGLTSFRGEIFYSPDSERTIMKPAGFINGYVVLVDHGYPMDIMDSVDQELWNYFEALFDPKSGWLKEGFETYGDLLVLNRMDIAPRCRGFGLGLATMYETIKRMGNGCAACAIHVCPIQFQNNSGMPEAQHFRTGGVEKWNEVMQIDKFSTKDQRTETDKLMRYYAKLGFEPYENGVVNNLMTMDLALRQPKFKDLAKDGEVLVLSM